MANETPARPNVGRDHQPVLDYAEALVAQLAETMRARPAQPTPPDPLIETRLTSVETKLAALLAAVMPVKVLPAQAEAAITTQAPVAKPAEPEAATP